MSEQKFVYYENDPDWAAQQKAQVDARAANQSNKEDWINVKYKFSNGQTKFRVMPKYKEGKDKGWFVKTLEHFEPVKTVCPRLHDLRCPICEKSEELDQQGEEKLAKSYRPGVKWWINAIILSEENAYKAGAEPLTAKAGIFAFKIPTQVKNFLLNMDTNYTAGYGDITNLEKGFDVIVDRAAAFSTDMYKPVLFARPTNIVEVLAEQGLDINSFSMVDLDALVEPMSYDEIVDAMAQVASTQPAGRPAPAPVKLGVVSPTKTKVETEETEPVNVMQPVKVTGAVPVPNIPRPPVVPRPGGK